MNTARGPTAAISHHQITAEKVDERRYIQGTTDLMSLESGPLRTSGFRSFQMLMAASSARTPVRSMPPLDLPVRSRAAQIRVHPEFSQLLKFYP